MVASPERSKVRSAGRAIRQAIVGAERAQREAALMAHLCSLPAASGASVGVFVADDGEPDLTPLTQLLWKRGQTVALPVLEDDPADFSMQFRTWSPDVTLIAGRYSIPVPPTETSRVITPGCLLVSLTAFDSMGNRMGRGAGFFDRYLANVDSQIVGVAFESQRIARVPTQGHDIAMPVVVTDLGVRYVS